MKIAVIFTGGTIGSRTNNKWITVDATTKYDLLKHYENDKDITFKTFSPYNILSENLSAKELNLLQKELCERLSENYDGIIVTHGSDTLQCTSTAIEMAFGNCSIPVIFVSADYPLDNEKSNGYPNFRCAVEFIKNKIANGVFVSYKNDDELITNIHIPSRILMHNELNANIYSINRKPFAEFNGEFKINNVNIPENKEITGIVNYTDDSQILVIPNMPGQSYSYNLDNTKAILFRSYHSATLNTANKKFVAFCKKASEMNIPMFVLGPESDTNYESTKVFKDLNIKILPYGTFISAYMKLWAKISTNTLN
ncbi:MAG: asparaginase [Clostridia bacterium]|nr:asparaginase [Clostridia bacterium]